MNTGSKQGECWMCFMHMKKIESHNMSASWMTKCRVCFTMCSHIKSRFIVFIVVAVALCHCCLPSTSSETATVISLTLILSAIYQKRLLTRFQNIFHDKKKSSQADMRRWICWSYRSIILFLHAAYNANLSNSGEIVTDAHWGFIFVKISWSWL